MEPDIAPVEMLPQGPGPAEPGAQAPHTHGWLARAATFSSDVGKIAVGLIGTALFVAVVVVLVQTVDQRTIVIQAIDVPESLADDGYTAEVAAKRLRDTLRKYVDDANTRMKSPNLALHGDVLQFVVPTVGLSFESIVAWVRTFFRRENRMNISGEFIFTESKLKLRLRKNATVIYTTPSTINSTNPDDLFADAAQTVFTVTEPYYVLVALSHRNPEKALDAAQQIIAAESPFSANTAWAHNLIGTIWFKKRKITKAMEEYQNAVTADPKFALAYYNLGVVLRELGKTDDAIVAFQGAIWIDPDFADAYTSLGNALKRQGRDKEGEAQKTKAWEKRLATLRDNPEDASAHHYYGLALLDDGKLPEAVDELQKAIELNPDNVTTHYDLAKALRTSGQLDESIKQFESAIALDAKHHADGYQDPEVHYGLAVAFLCKGDTKNAQSEFQTAIVTYGDIIKRDPEDATAYKERGNVKLDMQDFDGAVKDYNEAIRLDPNFASAYNDLCYLRAVNDRELDQAVSNCTKSLSLVPNDPDALDSLGLTYLKLKQFDKAVATYDKAITARPSLAESLYGRGVAKWMKGDPIGGKKDLDLAKGVRTNIAADMKRYGVDPPPE